MHYFQFNVIIHELKVKSSLSLEVVIHDIALYREYLRCWYRVRGKI